MSFLYSFTTTTLTTSMTTTKATNSWSWSTALLLTLSAALCASARPLNENFPIFEPSHDVKLDILTHPDASPLSRRSSVSEALVKRSNDDSNGSGSSMKQQMWIPILVLAVVFGIFAIVVCARRNFRRAIGISAAAQLETDPDIAAARNAANGQANGQGTQQRRRRPRRTPSQISTKSLPAYMKEPGDQELVIIRGPMDMEDEGMDVTDEAMALRRIETHATADTLPIASTTHLLRPIPTQESVESTTNSSAASHGTDPSLLQPSDGLHGHHAHPSAEPADPRGETPSYMEAISSDNLNQFSSVNLNDEPQPLSRRLSVSRALQQAASPDPAPGSTEATGTVRDRRSRGSVLLGRLNPFSNSAAVRPDQIPIPPDPEANAATATINSSNLSATPGHSRNLSSATTTTNSSSSHDPSRPSGQHRRGHSRGISQALRTLRSHTSQSSLSALSHGHNNMTSPSMISLNSISAPLTHTARRSEFYAPKGGLLTPEQVKLITSREALDKFGVPYGPDALAFSASRVNVVPPPPFEGGDELPGQPSATGQEAETSGSGGRNESEEERVQTQAEESSTPSHEPEEADVDPELAFGPSILPPLAPLSPVQSVNTPLTTAPSSPNVDSAALAQRHNSVRSMVSKFNSINDDSAAVARRMSTMSTRSAASIAASDVTSPSRRATIIAPRPAASAEFSPSRRDTVIISSPLAEEASPSRRATIVGLPASTPSSPTAAPAPSSPAHAHAHARAPPRLSTAFLPERNSSVRSTRSAFQQRTTSPTRAPSTRSVRTAGAASPTAFSAYGPRVAHADADGERDYNPQIRAISRASTVDSVSSFATAEQSLHDHGHDYVPSQGYGHYGGTEYHAHEDEDRSEDDSGEETEYDDADPGTPLTARSGTPTSVRRR